MFLLKMAAAVSFLFTVLFCLGGCHCENSGISVQEQPSSKSAETDTANLFVNGGFEDGVSPWFFLEKNRLWSGFSVSESRAHRGNASAKMLVDAGRDAPKARIYGVIQEVRPEVFPDIISGCYRIEKWKRGSQKQYLQVVVIVFGDRSIGELPNYQIRYILTGIDEPPFRIGNGKFIILGPKKPVVEKWVSFKMNIREDFKEEWGRVPQSYEKIRVLFEVRYDQRLSDTEPVLAEVYYDDLFMGTESESEPAERQ